MVHTNIITDSTKTKTDASLNINRCWSVKLLVQNRLASINQSQKAVFVSSTGTSQIPLCG